VAAGELAPDEEIRATFVDPRRLQPARIHTSGADFFRVTEAGADFVRVAEGGADSAGCD